MAPMPFLVRFHTHTPNQQAQQPWQPQNRHRTMLHTRSLPMVVQRRSQPHSSTMPILMKRMHAMTASALCLAKQTAWNHLHRAACRLRLPRRSCATNVATTLRWVLAKRSLAHAPNFPTRDGAHLSSSARSRRPTSSTASWSETPLHRECRRPCPWALMVQLPVARTHAMSRHNCTTMRLRQRFCASVTPQGPLRLKGTQLRTFAARTTGGATACLRHSCMGLVTSRSRLQPFPSETMLMFRALLLWM
mmetsp:Transcript_58858/g.170759  ORF Transcript_58858/g.170759 Transcript_58858/m.170759 type:complete len:248 (-) Transcript_58858:202-945(-)